MTERDGVPRAAEWIAENDTLISRRYGAPDKPNPYEYSVPESADIVEDLVEHLGVKSTRLVIHDYGVIVGQELLDRANRGELRFAIESLVVLNAGIVYSAYRPTRMQKLLIRPVVGKLVASRQCAVLLVR
jgi:pimeloyl-ACP methyl ester carboxylesterase